eukprot:TRINITY_DN7190_c0_g1_i1.p1 TRINITY_DN7190_c0_g1~~TRINITY_DN7190_c0_g1_i1.p1  ORF type:complete len:357 (-),score=73.19 TRINITY_DN7190_c0_g1_i1:38-1024(-)
MFQAYVEIQKKSFTSVPDTKGELISKILGAMAMTWKDSDLLNWFHNIIAAHSKNMKKTSKNRAILLTKKLGEETFEKLEKSLEEINVEYSLIDDNKKRDRFLKRATERRKQHHVSQLDQEDQSRELEARPNDKRQTAEESEESEIEISEVEATKKDQDQIHPVAPKKKRIVESINWRLSKDELHQKIKQCLIHLKLELLPGEAGLIDRFIDCVRAGTFPCNYTKKINFLTICIVLNWNWMYEPDVRGYCTTIENWVMLACDGSSISWPSGFIKQMIATIKREKSRTKNVRMRETYHSAMLGFDKTEKWSFDIKRKVKKTIEYESEEEE